MEQGQLRDGELAARIRYFREAAGMRQAALAEAVGVTRGTVSQWESSDAEPTHENLARIARACGVSLAEFWAAAVVVVPQPREGR